MLQLKGSVSTAVKRSKLAQYEQSHLMAATYREIQNTFSKSRKIKQFLAEREALNVKYLWESSCLFSSDFIAPYFVLSLYF